MPVLMPQRDVDAKVRQYEVFVNDVLKEDLRKSNISKAKLQAELEEYEDLESNLRLLQQVCVCVCGGVHACTCSGAHGGWSLRAGYTLPACRAHGLLCCCTGCCVHATLGGEQAVQLGLQGMRVSTMHATASQHSTRGDKTCCD